MKNTEFRILTDDSIVDLIPYLKSKLEETDNVFIYVGCDSQNVRNKTVYACAIVLHYGTRGGHVIYYKKKIDRIRDKFNRLWKETEFSVELAQYLLDNGIKKVDFIDLDFNVNPKYASYQVMKASVGYVESMGFTPRLKPTSLAASQAADKLCNR